MWCVIQWQVSVAVYGTELCALEIHAEILTFHIAYVQDVCTQSGTFTLFKYIDRLYIQSFNSEGLSNLVVEYLFAVIATFGKEVVFIFSLFSKG